MDRINGLLGKGYTVEWSDSSKALRAGRHAECKMCGEITNHYNGAFAVTTDHSEKTATPWVICNRCADVEDEAGEPADY